MQGIPTQVGTVNTPISPPPVATLRRDGPEVEQQEGGLLEHLQYYVVYDLRTYVPSTFLRHHQSLHTGGQARIFDQISGGAALNGVSRNFFHGGEPKILRRRRNFFAFYVLEIGLEMTDFK